MSWRSNECPSCGKPVAGLFAQLNHCDVYEPIDDLDDNPDIIKASD